METVISRTTYEVASEEVHAVVARMLAAHCPDLAETGAVIGAIMATNDSGPAVKLHGTAALATVRVVSAKDRVMKKVDAEILIDAGEWSQLLPEQQDALIHHEILHIRRVEYKVKQLAKLRVENPDCPAWRLDEHGRPKLKTVPADITPGDVFLTCVEVHGRSAVEFVGIKRAWDACEEVVHMNAATA